MRALLVALAVLAAPAPARAATDAQRDAAVRWAVAQAGHHERGTTNCSSLIDGWIRGMGFPARPCRAWCGAYVHEAFRRQGINLSQRLIDPDRTYDDVIAGRRGLRRISRNDVRRGDLLLFALRRGLKASHLAIVRSRPSKGVVLTAEGNVSHAVRLQRRGVKYAVLAARVT